VRRLDAALFMLSGDQLKLKRRRRAQFLTRISIIRFCNGFFAAKRPGSADTLLVAMDMAFCFNRILLIADPRNYLSLKIFEMRAGAGWAAALQGIRLQSMLLSWKCSYSFLRQPPIGISSHRAAEHRPCRGDKTKCGIRNKSTNRWSSPIPGCSQICVFAKLVGAGRHSKLL
jgi:hypothetical protein